MKSNLTVQEAGARGGRTTMQRYGRQFYKEIRQKNGPRIKKLYRKLFKEYGKRGGRPPRPLLSNEREGCE